MNYGEGHIVINGNMASNITSDTIYLRVECMLSIQAIWTGTPTGTLKIQTSNIPGQAPAGGNPTGITTWTDYTGTSQSLTGSAGDFVWRFTFMPDTWARLVYTASSGSGTLNVYSTSKG